MPIRILPVVHVTCSDQAVEQSGLALEQGADGVFVIGHSVGTSEVIEALDRVMAAHSGAFVGVNLLGAGSGANAAAAMLDSIGSGRLRRMPDAVWCDDASYEAEAFVNLRSTEVQLAGLRYYGGVSFKYTSTFTEDPSGAADEARRMAPFVDVVTTSGSGTGRPPTPEKIRAMKEAIGHKPLAVASGIGVDNLSSFEGVLDEVLVATSIETEPYSGEFDVSAMRRLLDLASRLA